MRKVLQKWKKLCLLLILPLLVTGFSGTVYADDAHSYYATSGEMAEIKDVAKYGMTPISGDQIKDGTWEIEVDTSSSFFIVDHCELTVKDGEMTAKMYMYSYSYDLLYLGTAEDAAKAPASDYIEYTDEDYWCIFTIPVEALNKPITCAAFSVDKEKWYYREILFDASTLDAEALNGLELPDYDLIEKAVESYNSGETADSETGAASSETGTSTTGTDASAGTDSQTGTVSDGTADSYGGNLDVDNPSYGEAMDLNLEDGSYSIEVAIAGGSGRATISTPTLLIVKDGKAYAQLLWSSTYYDWMRVGGVVYENETTDGGNSTFTIPVCAMDSLIPVVADTTAMGDPVPIQYTLTFYRESIGDEGLIPQVAAKKVVIFAAVIIVAGFFLNLAIKKKKKYR